MNGMLNKMPEEQLHEATELLVKQYPEYEEWIRIFYDRWEDMLGGDNY